MQIGVYRWFVYWEPDNIDFKSAAPVIAGVTMFRTQGNSFHFLLYLSYFHSFLNPC